MSCDVITGRAVPGTPMRRLPQWGEFRVVVTGESTTVTSSDISAGQRFPPHRRILEVRSSTTRRLNFQTCAANITSKINRVK